MSQRSPILGALRELWLSGALPLVVEHQEHGAESVCAAPSLWMGGRRHAHRLRAEPPAWVQPEGTPGADWVQLLVGALRAGVPFVMPAAARVDPQSPPWQGAVVVLRGEVVAAEALLARALAAARRCGITQGKVVHTSGDWSDPAVFFSGVMAPLCVGAELHLGPDSGDVAAVLKRADTVPDVVVACSRVLETHFGDGPWSKVIV